MKIGYIYRYIFQGKVIYVGKSDKNVIKRFKAHEKEAAFVPYINNIKIEYFVTPNSAYTQIYETYFINKYKPILNTTMKHEEEMVISIDNPVWIEYTGNQISRTIDINYYNKRREKTVYEMMTDYKKDAEFYREQYDKAIQISYSYCMELVKTRKAYQKYLKVIEAYKRLWEKYVVKE